MKRASSITGPAPGGNMSQEYERLTRLGAQILPRRHQHDLLPAATINVATYLKIELKVNFATLSLCASKTKVQRSTENMKIIPNLSH